MRESNAGKKVGGSVNQSNAKIGPLYIKNSDVKMYYAKKKNLPRAKGLANLLAMKKSVAELSDTGRGFAPGVLNELFDPALKKSGGTVGMSLRLPIAKRAIEDHGGDIQVESTVGSGTRYTVRLPVT